MNKKVYFDATGSNGCTGVIFTEDVEVISAGTTVYSMNVKDKNSDYQIYSDEYDLSFIFDDNIPNIDFYAVPQIDVFATDSSGGLFGTIGRVSDLECDAPICYINQAKECFIAAHSLKAFLQILTENFDWRKSLEPTDKVVFYKSKAGAEQSGLEFLILSQ